jgi:hypothetical protein
MNFQYSLIGNILVLHYQMKGRLPHVQQTVIYISFSKIVLFVLTPMTKIIKEDLFEYKCWTSPLPYLGYGFHVTMHDNAHPSKTDIVIHSTTNMIEKLHF